MKIKIDVVLTLLFSFLLAPICFLLGYFLVRTEQRDKLEFLRTFDVAHQTIEKFLNKDFEKSQISIASWTGNVDEIEKYFDGDLLYSLNIFNEKGLLKASVYRDAQGALSRREFPQGAEIFLNAVDLERLRNHEKHQVVEVHNGLINLIALSRMDLKNLWIVEQTFEFSKEKLSFFRASTEKEIAIFSREQKLLMTTFQDLSLIGSSTNSSLLTSGFSQKNIGGVEFQIFAKPFKWGNLEFNLLTMQKIPTEFGADIKEELMQLTVFISILGCLLILLVTYLFWFKATKVSKTKGLEIPTVISDQNSAEALEGVSGPTEEGKAKNSINTILSQAIDSSHEIIEKKIIVHKFFGNVPTLTSIKLDEVSQQLHEKLNASVTVAGENGILWISTDVVDSPSNEVVEVTFKTLNSESRIRI
jgi:hypothetical protein